MLKNRRIRNTGIAFALAAVTVVSTHQWLQQETSRLGAAVASTPDTSLRILVAARTLSPGAILGRDDLIWQPWPADGNLEGYFVESGSKPEDLVGAVVRSGIAQGEPLTRDGVVQPGDRSFLAAVLRPGHRAVSIAVTASTGVSGFIRPGDRVDVILSRVSQGGTAPRVMTNTILTGVRVVGIDQRAATDASDVVVPQTATLEVTPIQAEAIAAATELGKLSLALRSIAAAGGDVGEGMTVQPFWQGELQPVARLASASRSAARPAPRAVPLPQPATPTVEIVRGVTVSVEALPQ